MDRPTDTPASSPDQVNLNAVRNELVRNLVSVRDELLAFPEQLSPELRAQMTPDEFTRFEAAYRDRIEAAIAAAIRDTTNLCEGA